MLVQEVDRVGEQLNTVGHVLTSFEALGINQYERLAVDLVNAVEDTDQYREAAENGRSGMLMFREDEPLKAGRLLAEPVFEILFADKPEAITAMGMYAINHYEVGDFFNPHQDHFDGTVVIMTPLGRRQLDIYRPEAEDDVFTEVTDTYDLVKGSIMLLNGYKNLGHAAKCTEGPSLSVVADVPMMVGEHA
ncbi:MAG: hypothetical protein AAB462_02500 [Patescibacteria group bacterium]